jgi:predicted amino acid-binding ACT domain protein
MKTRFEHAYVLDIMAEDRPGIIARVSGVLKRLGGNIDQCSQTVLEGYFTLILVVSLPKPVEPEDLAREVRGKEAEGLQVLVRPFDAGVAARPASAAEPFVITAFGRDKPGIIAHLSQCLAGKDINITDLYWNRTNDDFVMVSQVAIPSRLDLAMLQADLEAIAAQEGFTVRLQHENIFVATNTLRLTTPKD